uniref:Hemagglutinin-neuraminidase n=1 Tax=avian paramyxovirus 4 TaxID=28274 RepID=M1GUX9_9MONO|nr:hemagglutinin-neuraminidase [Avian paramyxovirus 4]
MEGSRDNLTVDDELKTTWRLAYRVVSLLLMVSALIISIVILTRDNSQSIITAINQSSDADSKWQTGIEGKITSIMADTLDTRNAVLLHIPLQLNTLEANLLSALGGNTGIGPGDLEHCRYPVHDTAYLHGVNRLLINQTADYTAEGPLDHVNFIPAPVTTTGCTRIPSFSVSSSIWCYTHNVIETGCNDHSGSNQYISMGVIKRAGNGLPYFSTVVSKYLTDGLNRKSCSVAAGSGHCYLLCSLVSEPEPDDYVSPDPTPMRLGVLTWDGSYTEQVVPERIFRNIWSANYPGVGSGAIVGNKVLFPFYGGVRNGSTPEVMNRGRYYYIQDPNDYCPDPLQDQILRAEQSYYPTRFGRRMIMQGVLACPVSNNSTIASQCQSYYFNNSLGFIGAESRIYYLNSNIYLYQRSSSWWPHPQIYLLDSRIASPGTQNIDSGVNLKMLNVTVITRPSSGFCNSQSRCPNDCLFGVYSDIWPLSLTSDSIFAFTMYLQGKTTRIDPAWALFSNHAIGHEARLFNKEVSAAYSTTTCFLDTIQNQVYCLSILEVRSELLGAFKIVPFLYRVL